MSNQEIRWSISEQNVVVNYQGETHIVKRSDALAERLIKAIKERKMDQIPTLVSAAKRIEVYSKGTFQVQDGRVMVNGLPAPEVLSNKILRFSDEGLPYGPLVKFAENLQANPSFRAVNELYTFLEKNDHPLTENGNFIAYKRVRSDFKDIHSGTFDNSPGAVLEMPRNQVNEDSSQTCSHGLHVANWTYAHTQFASYSPGSDIMLEVEVNPADVVSIPVDYNNAKMRVCKYKVLGVVTQPFEPEMALRVTNPESFSVDEVDEEECETCTECGCDLDDLDDAYEHDGRCEACCEVCNEDTESCVECGANLDVDNDHGDLCVDCCGCEEEDKYPFHDEFE